GGARQRIGAARATRAWRADARPHHIGDRAPAVHGGRSRPDHRIGSRTHPGKRNPPGIAGARRFVRGAARDAGKRVSDPEMSVQAWLNRVWYERGSPPWWLLPLSLSYGAAAGARRYLYSKQLRKSTRVAAPRGG